MASSKWSLINFLSAILCFTTCQMFGQVFRVFALFFHLFTCLNKDTWLCRFGCHVTEV